MDKGVGEAPTRYYAGDETALAVEKRRPSIQYRVYSTGYNDNIAASVVITNGTSLDVD